MTRQKKGGGMGMGMGMGVGPRIDGCVYVCDKSVCLE